MNSPQIKLFVLLTSLASITFTSVAQQNAPINKDARELAKVIPKYDASHSVADAQNHMTRLIHLLSATKRNSVSSNSALVKKALDFRDDIGAQQKVTTSGALLKAWEVAYGCGAIRHTHYTGLITQGRYEGESLVFENVVPAKELPRCAGYIGNLRLVPESLARKSDASTTTKDSAFARGLMQIMHEARSHAALNNPLGMSEEEHEARWLREVETTGEAYKQSPYIRLLCKRRGNPSAVNGYSYTLEIEATNTSRHPTEVTLESTIVGYTDNENKIYEMRKDIRVVKLRRNQVYVFNIKSPNVQAFHIPLSTFDPKGSQKVIYRGYTLKAIFNDKVVSSMGSDGRMARVASGEYTSPQMIASVSRSNPVANAGAANAVLSPMKGSGRVTFDFESGDLQGWYLAEGEIGHLVASNTLTRIGRVPLNKEGVCYLGTLEVTDGGAPSDAQTGIVESPVFQLDGSRIEFAIAGGKHQNTYLGLYTYDGKEIRKTSAKNSEMFTEQHWDVPEMVGKPVFLRLVDQNKGGWGHIVVDAISAEGKVLVEETSRRRVLVNPVNRERDYLSKVEEANKFKLVYDLDLKTLANDIIYTTDQSGEIVTGSFDRVGYFIELHQPNGIWEWTWVAMDAFTDSANQLGVPYAGSGVHWQKQVNNLSVLTHRSKEATSLAVGNLEFWSDNYGPENNGNVPGAAADRWDFGDNPVGKGTVGYGSMQVHDTKAGETIFAINNWRAGLRADIGLGKSTGTTSDWTFSASGATLLSARLRVLVRSKD